VPSWEGQPTNLPFYPDEPDRELDPGGVTIGLRG
jgi:hypothetical protein